MGVAEAFETLGLSEPGTITAEQLKRAYLRKVRAHPPERDPDGFQRIRKAYELIQQVGTWQAHRAARSPESVPAEVAPAEVASVEIAPAEVALVPQLAAAPQLAEDASRPAAQAEAEHPIQRLGIAFNNQRWTAAANALLEIYADASRAGAVPPPQIALQIALELFATSRHKTARRVMEAFAAHMALGARPLNTDIASAWKLLGELADLSREVEPTLTSALAESIRSGAFHSAAPELRSEVTQHGEAELVERMKAHAPTLFAATWPYVPRDPVRRKRRVGVSSWSVTGSLFVIFSLFKVLSGITDNPSTERPVYTAPAAALPAPRPIPDTRLEDLSATETAVVSDASRLHDVTSTIEQLYLTGQCDETRNVWATYVSLLVGLGPNDTARQGYAFRRAQAIAACPALTSELPEHP